MQAFPVVPAAPEPGESYSGKIRRFAGQARNCGRRPKFTGHENICGKQEKFSKKRKHSLPDSSPSGEKNAGVIAASFSYA
jgi:hypothetical protein